MPDAWSPRRARLTRNAAGGASTLTVTSSFAASSMLMKLGTELVTATGSAGVNQSWTITPSLAEHHDDGAYLVEVTVRVVVDPAGSPVDHSAIAQNLHHRESAPAEGELEATWELDTLSPSAWTPNLDGNPVRFLLYSNESGSFVPFFGGYIGRVVDGQYPNGSHHLHITGRGSYVTAGWQVIPSSTTWNADTAGHTVVEDAFNSYAPYVSSDHTHVIDGGLQIGQVLEGIGRTPRQLIDWVTSKGDLTGPLDWYVRTDADGGHKLWLILRSRNPTIEIPISSLKAPCSAVKDYEHRRNLIYVKWRDGYADAGSGSGGAIRSRYFDYSTQIDNYELARQVAGMILENLNVIETISNGQVTVEWPKPIYLDSAEYPHHRVRAGWFVTFTGWDGAFSLTTAQIKALDADHTNHTLSLNVGKILEDDLQIGAQYFDKQTKMLGNPGSGLIPLNIAPPEGMPYQVQSSGVAAGANGLFGPTRVMTEGDMTQSTYNIDGGRDTDDTPVMITAGLQFPIQKIKIGGRVTGFTLNGNDGDRTTPGPGTISIAVYHVAVGSDPAVLGTLVATLDITSDTEGHKNLLEPPATSDKIIDITPGDYLQYVVLPGAITLNNVAIDVAIQRTGGSDRVVSSGAPTISGQSASRDATTGIVTFSITCDRPVYAQVEFGSTSSYGGWSQKTEIISKTPTIPVVLASPFHWRVIVTDRDGHVTTGADQTF